MVICAAVLAAGIVIGYDRYTSPDRIDEKPFIQQSVDYTDVDENMATPTSGQRLEEFFHKELLQDIQPRHWSPDEKDYQTAIEQLCLHFGDMCDRIRIVGDYHPRTAYLYTAIPLYLAHHFDLHIRADRKFGETLRSIAVSDDGGRRWYASHDSIIIYSASIDDTKEYLEIMTHEMGHVVDLGVVRGTMKRRDPNFTEFGKMAFSLDDPSLDFYRLSRESENTRKSGQTRQDFCSGYGQHNPFEDFAECMNLYINHHDLFDHISSRSYFLRRKYAYIKELFDGFYLYRDTASVAKYSDPSQFYVFDTSKIWK